MLELLVIKHDVREPDVSGGNMQTVDPSVLLRVPAELVVVPVLLYPQVGRHHLLPQVLQHKIEIKTTIKPKCCRKQANV